MSNEHGVAQRSSGVIASGVRWSTFASLGAMAMLSSMARAQSVDDLRSMSIEELAAVNVTSVSKTEQPLSDAAAAIYVISHDDIVRSGAVTLPEMLRLAPNLQVYQTGPGQWAVTARGLNGNLQAQNFSSIHAACPLGESVRA